MNTHVEKSISKLCILSKLFDEKVRIKKTYSNVIGNLKLPPCASKQPLFLCFGLIAQKQHQSTLENVKKSNLKLPTKNPLVKIAECCTKCEL